jgi:RNA polymerase sigma factor (sigma-70 family)
MADVTHMLVAIEAGDSKAAAELLPLVYDELRKLAAACLASEPSGQTLQPTALVHEAYLRLLGNPKSEVRNSKPEPGADSGFEFRTSDFPRFEGCGHFFAAAAEAMRRILIEAARRKKRIKHGGGFERIDLANVEVAAPARTDDLLALDESLTKFAAEYPAHARLVTLRYFAGLTLPEAARVLGISDATADRHWAFARAWLRAELADPIG